MPALRDEPVMRSGFHEAVVVSLRGRTLGHIRCRWTECRRFSQIDPKQMLGPVTA